MKVLILSSDDEQRKAIIAALRERLGYTTQYQVHTANDVTEARHALRRWPINIFVSVTDDDTVNFMELITPQLVAYGSHLERVVMLDYDETYGPASPGVIVVATFGGEYDRLVDTIVVGFADQSEFEATLEKNN